MHMINTLLVPVRKVNTNNKLNAKVCSYPRDPPAHSMYLICLDLFAQVTRQVWLMPAALQMPGWLHMFDNILKEVANYCAFFPAFMKSLKVVCAFWRSESYRLMIVTNLRAKGLPVEAKAFAQLKFPTFANWRFSKLEDCAVSVRSACVIVSEHLELHAFDGCRDKEDWRTTFFTMRDGRWRLQLDFIATLSKTIGSIRVWGSGCSCHETQLLEGKRVACALKGRRAAEASDYIKGQCVKLLATASNITLEYVGNDVPMQIELATAYRMAGAAVQKRTQFLDALPYLLSR